MDDDFDDDAGLEAALNEALDAGKPQAEPPLDETPAEQEAREYVREGRRFVPKPKDETPPAEQAADPTQAAPAQQPKAWRPPWLKDEHGVDWDKTPEQFRKAMEQRERDFAKGIEQHATPAKAWRSIEERFAPHKDVLERAGTNVQAEIDGLLTHYERLLSPNIGDRLTVLNDLVQRFTGRDSIEQLAYDMQQAGYQPPPQPDPHVQALQQEIAQLKQGLNGIQSSAQQQQTAAVQAEIAAFAKDKPDFETVKPLMKGLLETGAAATLQDAYEQARWAHPDTRTRILADQRKQDVARARAGAQSPRGGPVANGSARMKPTMSLEDEIAMHLDGGV